jgi:hypothetical protein
MYNIKCLDCAYERQITIYNESADGCCICCGSSNISITKLMQSGEGKIFVAEEIREILYCNDKKSSYYKGNKISSQDVEDFIIDLEHMPNDEIFYLLTKRS